MIATEQRNRRLLALYKRKKTNSAEHKRYRVEGCLSVPHLNESLGLVYLILPSVFYLPHSTFYLRLAN